MEDLHKKEAAEAAALREEYKWKAKPVPRSVKENRYQAILDQQEAKRLRAAIVARKERLTEILQPFPDSNAVKGVRAASHPTGGETPRRQGKGEIGRQTQKEESARRFRAAAAKVQQPCRMPARRLFAGEPISNGVRTSSCTLHECRRAWRCGKSHSNKRPRRRAPSRTVVADGGPHDAAGRVSTRCPFKWPLARSKNILSGHNAGLRSSEGTASRPKAPSRPFSFMSKERLEQDRQRRRKTEERILRMREQDERNAKGTKML